MQKFTLIKKCSAIALLAILTLSNQNSLNAQVSDTIGMGNVVTNSYGPIRMSTTASTSFSTKVINLYTQSELAAAGIFPGAIINSVAWRKSTIGVLSNGASVNVAVSLRDQVNTLSYGTSSTTTIYANTYIGSNFTAAGSQAFSATGTNLPADSTWVTIPFSAPFTYTGGGIEVLINSTVTNGTGAPVTVNLNWKNTSSVASNIYQTLYTNNPAAYNNTVTVNAGNIRPNVIFNYIPGAVCSGTPAGGSINMDTVRACPGMLSGHLSLNGASAAGGVTIQWEKKTSSDPSFIPISGATGYVLFNQIVTTPTLYHAVVTCSGNSVISSEINMIPTSSILPNYTMNFNFPSSWITTTIPNCWEGRKGLMDYPVTFLTNSSGYAAGSWSSDGWNNASTLGAAKIRTNAVAYDWFLTPVIDLGTSGNWQIDFDLGVFTFNAQGAGVMDADDRFVVVISTDSGATFSEENIIGEINASNTTFPLPNGYKHVTIPLTSYTGKIKIGFYSTGGSLDPVPSSLAPDVMLDNFQVLPLGTVVLPVKMSLLSGKLNSKNIAHLTWNTFKEENNIGFAIEMSSDGSQFKDIGLVPTKAKNGNSNEKISYDFNYPTPLNKSTYFRLKQMDKDGSTNYTNIVNLNPDDIQNSDFNVSPNPVTDYMNVRYDGTVSGDERFYITDATGHVINSYTISGATNKIDLSALRPGIYFIKFTTRDESITRKIVKQ